LHGDILRCFGISVSATLIKGVRRALSFSWQPVRHIQQLSELQVEERMALCRKMLDMPDSLGRICFSDESPVVLGSDRRLI
jgi:hypothetical protein